METIWEWGLGVIAAIQQFHGPLLDELFRAITFLGEEEFFLLLLPLVFWCVGFRLGAHLGMLLLFSSGLNAGLKELFQHPRPFKLDPTVALATAEGYGLPSGHAQMAVVLWGTVATWTHKRWLRRVAIALIVLIGFSRVYLGVHFPTDVLAGWALGALSLLVYLRLRHDIEDWLRRRALGTQFLLAFGVPVALFLLYPTEDSCTALAAAAGAGLGLVLASRYVAFNAQGPLWQRVARFLLGMVITLAIYIGLKAILPTEGEALYLPSRFLRYGLLGIWISLGAPWSFQRLGLAPRSGRR